MQTMKVIADGTCMLSLIAFGNAIYYHPMQIFVTGAFKNVRKNPWH